MEQGTIVIQVYPKLMPVTVENFLDLAGSGFYDGLIWHRVENWVVQTGDPEGTGMGGSGKTIKLETNKNLKNVRGAVAMARSQARDSASSQFYVLKTDAPWLDGDYAVFGKVVSGMEIIDSLKAGDTMLRVKVEPK
ncbi:MAG TPA: peptidylprolyl isomerase [Firmicutes bacterium]|nr:peptidylprolyl isomerase [Bacillota bacterium]